MEFKGTKGKLIIKECYYSNPILSIENDNKEVFATVPMRDSSMHRFEYEMYNALLISKASEMLEMLIEIKDQMEDGRTYITKDDISNLIKSATEL